MVFGLSDAILGLTVLAWGNSIGDLIADTAMAKRGHPRTGFSACFGGPLFNLLLGKKFARGPCCKKKRIKTISRIRDIYESNPSKNKEKGP